MNDEVLIKIQKTIDEFEEDNSYGEIRIKFNCGKISLWDYRIQSRDDLTQND